MLNGCTMMGVVLVVGGILSHEVYQNKAGALHLYFHLWQHVADYIVRCLFTAY